MARYLNAVVSSSRHVSLFLTHGTALVKSRLYQSSARPEAGVVSVEWHRTSLEYTHGYFPSDPRPAEVGVRRKQVTFTDTSCVHDVTAKEEKQQRLGGLDERD